MSREKEKYIRGFKVKAVDSTGAGDAFNGAFASKLAEGESMESLLLFANAGGALAVTKMGAQPSLPTRKEIERLLKYKQNSKS